jgi:hypothetical protein
MPRQRSELNAERDQACARRRWDALKNRFSVSLGHDKLPSTSAMESPLAPVSALYSQRIMAMILVRR